MDILCETFRPVTHAYFYLEMVMLFKSLRLETLGDQSGPSSKSSFLYLDISIIVKEFKEMDLSRPVRGLFLQFIFFRVHFIF